MRIVPYGTKPPWLANRQSGQFPELINQEYEIAVGQGKCELASYKKQLIDHQNKISKARDLLLNGDLDGAEYIKIKMDSERQVSILEGKLLDLSSKNEGIGTVLFKALTNASKLPELYQSADSESKRQIVSSMYPEKLTFDGDEHRTLRVNQAICVFDSVKAVFEQKNERKSVSKLDFRSKVNREGRSSAGCGHRRQKFPRRVS